MVDIEFLGMKFPMSSRRKCKQHMCRSHLAEDMDATMNLEGCKNYFYAKIEVSFELTSFMELISEFASTLR